MYVSYIVNYLINFSLFSYSQRMVATVVLSASMRWAYLYSTYKEDSVLIFLSEVGFLSLSIMTS